MHKKMKIIAVFLISLNLAGCWFSRENCAMDCGRSPYTFEYGTGQFVCSIGKAKVFPFFYLDYNCGPEEKKIFYVDFYTEYKKYFLSDKECFSVCSNYLTPQKSAETLALKMSGMDADAKYAHDQAKSLSLLSGRDVHMLYNSTGGFTSDMLDAYNTFNPLSPSNISAEASSKKLISMIRTGKVATFGSPNYFGVNKVLFPQILKISKPANTAPYSNSSDIMHYNPING